MREHNSAMEMENDAQNDLAVPLISCDDPAFNAADAGRRSSLDDIEKVVPTEGAPSVADVDDTDKRNVTALSLAMIIFYNASGAYFGRVISCTEVSSYTHLMNWS